MSDLTRPVKVLSSPSKQPQGGGGGDHSDQARLVEPDYSLDRIYDDLQLEDTKDGIGREPETKERTADAGKQEEGGGRAVQTGMNARSGKSNRERVLNHGISLEVNNQPVDELASSIRLAAADDASHPRDVTLRDKPTHSTRSESRCDPVSVDHPPLPPYPPPPPPPRPFSSFTFDTSPEGASTQAFGKVLHDTRHSLLETSQVDTSHSPLPSLPTGTQGFAHTQISTHPTDSRKPSPVRSPSFSDSSPPSRSQKRQRHDSPSRSRSPSPSALNDRESPSSDKGPSPFELEKLLARIGPPVKVFQESQEGGGRGEPRAGIDEARGHGRQGDSGGQKAGDGGRGNARRRRDRDRARESFGDERLNYDDSNSSDLVDTHKTEIESKPEDPTNEEEAKEPKTDESELPRISPSFENAHSILDSPSAFTRNPRSTSLTDTGASSRFHYRFDVPSPRLAPVLIGRRGSVRTRVIESTGAEYRYIDPNGRSSAQGAIEGSVIAIRLALDILRDELERYSFSESVWSVLPRVNPLGFLDFDEVNLSPIDEVGVKDEFGFVRVHEPFERRRASYPNPSVPFRRSTATEYHPMPPDSSYRPPPPRRPETDSPELHRQSRGELPSPLDLDNSSRSTLPPPESSLQMTAHPVYLRPRRSSRSHSPSPDFPYLPTRRSPSPPSPKAPSPLRHTSSTPSVSNRQQPLPLSPTSPVTAPPLQDSNRAIAVDRRQETLDTKDVATGSIVIEIPLGAASVFFGPTSSLPHLERVSGTKLRLECDTLSARLYVNVSTKDNTSKINKLREGIEDTVRTVEGCQEWKIDGQVSQDALTSRDGSPSADTIVGLYPSPVSIRRPPPSVSLRGRQNIDLGLETSSGGVRRCDDSTLQSEHRIERYDRRDGRSRSPKSRGREEETRSWRTTESRSRPSRRDRSPSYGEQRAPRWKSSAHSHKTSSSTQRLARDTPSRSRSDQRSLPPPRSRDYGDRYISSTLHEPLRRRSPIPRQTNSHFSASDSRSTPRHFGDLGDFEQGGASIDYRGGWSRWDRARDASSPRETGWKRQEQGRDRDKFRGSLDDLNRREDW